MEDSYEYEWWEEEGYMVCSVTLSTPYPYDISTLKDFKKLLVEEGIPFLIKKQPPKEIEVWYDCTYRTFNLDEDYSFLIGKTINEFKVNRINPTKSFGFQKFWRMIEPAFLRPNTNEISISKTRW